MVGSPRPPPAAQLRDATGPAETLAKLTWSIHHNSPPEWAERIDRSTLVIIHEAGMADTVSLDTAVRFIIGRGGGIRLVGDDQQLAAISAGGVLRDIQASYGAVRLSELHRFTEPAEAAATLALRVGRPEAFPASTRTPTLDWRIESSGLVGTGGRCRGCRAFLIASLPTPDRAHIWTLDHTLLPPPCGGASSTSYHKRRTRNRTPWGDPGDQAHDDEAIRPAATQAPLGIRPKPLKRQPSNHRQGCGSAEPASRLTAGTPAWALRVTRTPPDAVRPKPRGARTRDAAATSRPTQRRSIRPALTRR